MPTKLVLAGVGVALVLLFVCSIKNAENADLRQDDYRLDRSTGFPVVSDVAGIHSAKVRRILYPLRTTDVERFLAHSGDGGPVCMRGAAHSMGGHTLCDGGTQIDLRHLNRLIKIDLKRRTATVEAGMHWSELIRLSNLYGLSPMTLQSYSSFSIGGSISVNAHGITNHHTVATSVVNMKVVLANGTSVFCSRQSNEELFRGVIGGFGLLGVVVQVTMKLVKNERYDLISTFHTLSEFQRLDINEPDVGVRIARVNLAADSPLDRDSVHLMRFKRADPALSICPKKSFASKCTNHVEKRSVVSRLGDEASEMGWASRQVYKWLFHLRWVQALRFWVERGTGKPIDWSSNLADRNSLLHESAHSLAQLDRRFIDFGQTHVLQEFFVPPGKLSRWLELFFLGVLPEIRRKPTLWLLNMTIRFVKKDPISILAYAHKSDLFALVLYFRVGVDDRAVAGLADIHSRITGLTQHFGGSFYLPYLHHYSYWDVESCYSVDRIKQFLELKRSVDPGNRFTNQWAERYLLKRHPDDFGSDSSETQGPIRINKKEREKEENLETVFETQKDKLERLLETLQSFANNPFPPRIRWDLRQACRDLNVKHLAKVLVFWHLRLRQTAFWFCDADDANLARFLLPKHLAHLFMPTIHAPKPQSLQIEIPPKQNVGIGKNLASVAAKGCLGMRELELFFRRVFVLVPEDEGRAIQERGKWYLNIGQHLEDRDLYSELQSYSDRRLGGGMYRAWRGLMALKRQKAEIVQEVGRLLRHIGAKLPLQNYLSIGDGGRYASALRSEQLFDGMEVHVSDSPISLAERLAFSSVRSWPHALSASVSQLFASNFSDSGGWLDGSGWADLIIVAIGLHHFPTELLPVILRKLATIVRRGGYLIIREHDADDQLVPLLNVAHSTFNAFTGVTYEAEVAELRHFRSMREWEQIVSSHGFAPSGLYETQPHDPTRNILTLFTRS